MNYGICHLNMVPLRLEPSDPSEMVSQVLYGEHFKVTEKRKKWSKIRLAHDFYEGWIDNKQFVLLTAEQYHDFEKAKKYRCLDLVTFAETEDHELLPLTLGVSLKALGFFHHKFEGEKIGGLKPKSNIINLALLYLNAPYLWGGRTVFGIDCSGFTQMVYLLNGYKLLRDASQQATQGEALSFIEESEPGDLAFFDNAEGKIIHVGILLKDNYIIHAHGKVRIDRIDHTGIFNQETKSYSHTLRVLKKII